MSNIKNTIWLDTINPQLDDQIILCLNKDGYGIYPTSVDKDVGSTTCLTVIAIDPTDSIRPYCLGWKKGQLSGFKYALVHDGGNPTSPIVMKCQRSNKISEYEKYLWVGNALVIPTGTSAKLGSSTTPVGGMNCANKYCNAFCHYAEPNQPDGITFLCYGCRHR